MDGLTYPLPDSVEFHQLDFPLTSTSCYLSFSEVHVQWCLMTHLCATGTHNCLARAIHALLPKPNGTDFHHTKFSLNTKIPCLFFLANLFCFLRIFFLEHSPSSTEEIKKRKEKKSLEFSFSWLKLQVACCVACGPL